MKRSVYLFLLFVVPLSLSAQTLRFVSADSVLLMDFGRTNIRATAMRVDTSLKAQTIEADTSLKEAQIKVWKDEIMPDLNILGSLGNAFDENMVFSASNNLYTAARLLLLTRDGRYAETMERTIYNPLLAAAFHKENPMQQHVAAQALLNASGMLYAQGEEGIYVNFFMNSLTRISHNGVRMRLDQVTQMPFSPRVRIRFDMQRGQHQFKVFLRLPEWASGEEYPVYVNGKDLPRRVVKDGYLCIDRKWSNGDEIYFDFPLELQSVRDSVKNRFALQLGPLVYAFPKDAGISSESPLDYTVEMPGGEEVIALSSNGSKALPVGYLSLPEMQEAAIWFEDRRSSTSEVVR